MESIFNKIKVDELSEADYSNLSEYCKRTVNNIQPNNENFNDLDATKNFSYANLLRFKKHIESQKWITPALYDIFINVNPLFGLNRLRQNSPDLFNAYSPGDINRPGWGVGYGPSQWNNSRIWLESNLKHLYLSDIPLCGFYFGIVTSLAAVGILRIWYDGELSLITENVKKALNFESIHNYKISVKNDISRESC